jgi:hypothetical protein
VPFAGTNVRFLLCIPPAITFAFPQKAGTPMSKPTTATFTGKSGQAYSFNVYQWGTDFKAIGAVYIVTSRRVNSEGKGLHTFIYIGHTGDLSERFDDHHKARCFTKHGVNCICIHSESDEATRLDIESDLIDGNDTSCNGT